MKQLVQLQANLENYRAAGLGVVAMTYDAAEVQQQFVDRHGIEFPMLADQAGASAKILGILNTQYVPGDNAYGIPYPGVFVVAPDGKVKAKVFLEAYSQRLSADAVLALAKTALGG